MGMDTKRKICADDTNDTKKKQTESVPDESQHGELYFLMAAKWDICVV